MGLSIEGKSVWCKKKLLKSTDAIAFFIKNFYLHVKKEKWHSILIKANYLAK
ncbi:hypothetical protein SAMN05660206_11292 [Sphingobacterium wenxiniae]|uniref:Uncharacterized protein n=1 Tax=Sphingobacterium wenxiniae TaxID=683125 RepID=A0A1I6VBS5_9SPHI|nr:hypothetical protein SAMN05660206_11292 [Sphingobacterium wenxiniae]